LSKKPRFSKRRLEVLASYGVFPEKNKKVALPLQSKPKPTNKKFEFDPLPDFSSLPKNSPIRIQRELEMQGIDTTTAKRNAKNPRQKSLNNSALRTKQSRKKHKPTYRQNESRLVNSIHLDGLLSACAAKKGTKDVPSAFDDTSAIFYNMQDNFIEEQYHGKTSAFDPRHNDLIEIDPSNGKMIWHGETCAICTMPPSNMGEVVLAQYGEANFICTDCGKLVETKGRGLRGWIFTQIQNIKRHKATQIKKYHLPNSEDDEELA